MTLPDTEPANTVTPLVRGEHHTATASQPRQLAPFTAAGSRLAWLVAIGFAAAYGVVAGGMDASWASHDGRGAGGHCAGGTRRLVRRAASGVTMVGARPACCLRPSCSSSSAPGSSGPTVDGIHLGSTYGIIAFVVGRGLHGLLSVVPDGGVRTHWGPPAARRAARTEPHRALRSRSPYTGFVASDAEGLAIAVAVRGGPRGRGRAPGDHRPDPRRRRRPCPRQRRRTDPGGRRRCRSSRS